MSVQGGMIASGKSRSAKITAIVTRADGKVEDLGTIAYWHRNPLKRWVWNILHAISKFGK